MLVAARFVQGLAGGVGIVIAQAAGRDIFDGRELIRFYGRLAVAGPTAAIVGPMIGGLLNTFMDWRGLFGFLAVVGLALLLVSATMFTETLPPERRTAGGLRRTGAALRVLGADRVFVGAVLSQGFVYAAIFSYLAGSTFVLQEIYGLSPQWYAAAFALNSAGGVFFGWLGGRTAERWNVHGALFLGIAQTGTGCLGLLLAGLAPMPLAVVIASLFLLASGGAVLVPRGHHARAVRVPADGGHRRLDPRHRPFRPRRARRPLRGDRRLAEHPAAGRDHHRRRSARRGRCPADAAPSRPRVRGARRDGLTPAAH